MKCLTCDKKLKRRLKNGKCICDTGYKQNKNLGKCEINKKFIANEDNLESYFTYSSSIITGIGIGSGLFFLHPGLLINLLDTL